MSCKLFIHVLIILSATEPLQEAFILAILKLSLKPLDCEQLFIKHRRHLCVYILLSAVLLSISSMSHLQLSQQEVLFFKHSLSHLIRFEHEVNRRGEDVSFVIWKKKLERDYSIFLVQF
ncbi:hypothetical protein ILYODFUR_008846 [Ilyodon furcidens]|uniref:Uncharacterized protein n=2 Tax=Goodeidae TaxID=28758 RepID=A0ABU7AT67_9TELE|nr:hypothetical protein [Ataeniobius toweri]